MNLKQGICKHDVFGDIYIEYSPRRRRMSLNMSIADNAVRLTLKLPVNERFLPDQHLAFIEENAAWICRNREKLQKKINLHSFDIGDKFYYLGNEYPLLQGNKSCFDGNAFYVSTHSPQLNKYELKKIYNRLAHNFIIPLASQYAADLGITIGKIRISEAKKRWGSCNSKGDLNFSLSLVMCPEDFIRYTICHELAHRFEMNHSKAFYAVLKRLYPAIAPSIEQWKYMIF